jgi:hypothetical protein
MGIFKNFKSIGKIKKLKINKKKRNLIRITKFLMKKGELIN